MSPVDTIAPTVTISSPATSMIESGTPAVSAAASDNVAVSKVVFQLKA